MVTDNRLNQFQVSIPFIAGQWSLLKAPLAAWRGRARFQSPSLRGSGRFPEPAGSPGPQPGKFQSPSLRGSGRFTRRLSSARCGRPLFQSPSLRGSGRFDREPTRVAREAPSFNPLHCGAVVASGARGSRTSWTPWCFNPLHCGAVVASNHVMLVAKKFDEFQSPSLRGSGRFTTQADFGCG